MSAPAVENPPGPPPSALRILVDPFARRGPRAAAAPAALAVALGFLASRFGVRFDGVLDVHLVGGPVPLGTALADQAVALLAPALVAWAALRGLGARAAFGRVAAVLGAARLPLVLAAPLAFVPLRAHGGVVTMDADGRAFVVDTLRPGSPPPALTPGLLADALAGLGALALIVWAVALAVAGLRAVGGLRGGRLAAASAAALLGGELLAKVVLAGLP